MTSFSTVAVAFGAPSALTFGEAVRLLKDGVLDEVAFVSGVAVVKLEVAVVGGVAISGLVVANTGLALVLSAVGLSGRASCEDIIAGSTGAPLTVACPVGGRLAGGVYLLPELEYVKGGKSCCLRTPLYLYWR